ncbi:uncharacterized protein LOC124930972 [Impatiens glandulifera]|uniref:uncharacterized protein LOC124930972 n=1 Tax=Impatiens glandulifera TaxID=253017 RepID=UPI001FB184DB|nr:uncharacterized protein LOC124930972 [Impatiens glandulifera]
MASRIVLLMVFVFDAIAFALAVVAEQRRTKATIQTVDEFASNDYSFSYCKYGSDIATGLGVASFVFLFASQVIVMAASRCLCFGRGLRPGSSRTWAIALFIVCWVTFLVAEICLLAGSIRNAYHTKYRKMIASDLSCETLRQGVFGAGAGFIVMTGIVSEVYYVNYAKSHICSTLPLETGIRMGSF